MGETCVRCGISPATSLVCPGSHRSRRDGFEVRELEGLLYESYGKCMGGPRKHPVVSIH